jgi:flavodoxin
MNALIIVHSYHHGNTRKIGEAMAEALGAAIVAPAHADPASLGAFDLVGFGSGIDSDNHYAPLLDFAERLPLCPGKRAFIFSTCGAPEALLGRRFIQEYSEKCHAALRARLLSKGYEVSGEFICAGFNTNAFLRRLGGINKSRPNAEDLEKARGFARSIAHRPLAMLQ